MSKLSESGWFQGVVFMFLGALLSEFVKRFCERRRRWHQANEISRGDIESNGLRYYSFIKNDLQGKDVKVMEGNAGISRVLTTLKPGQSYQIEIDPGKTYREFTFRVGPPSIHDMVCSTDDLFEYEEIKISEAADGECRWVGSKRKPRRE